MGGLQTAHSSVVGDALKAGFQNFVDQSATRVATVTTGAPAAGYFHSTIVGRAPIPDISNDLRASLGVERIATQSIMQLQNEFGSNGEPVFAAVNDDRGLIRFVGSMTIASGSYGQFINFIGSSDYLEVTFYGTGLNLLHTSVSGGRSYTPTIDGSVGSVVNLSGSSILENRGYSPNIVVSVVTTGLSLGMHTVKIQSSTLAINGLEILNANASGYINLNTGTAYIQGQKVLNSVSDSVLYNAGVTGAKGGRVVRYLNADGTVGQAFQAVDTTSYTLTNANHTNEEVVRTYHYREFGAGRTASAPDIIGQDFSLLPSTIRQSASFTLDDGTTSLSAYYVSSEFSTQPSGVWLREATAFVIFSFVGTGLDIIRYDGATSAGPDAIQYFIDGASLGTVVGLTQAHRKVSIVSGLPYGTHTFKMLCTVQNVSAASVSRFIVYGP